MFLRALHLSAIFSLVIAHGTITAISGANGVTGAGMGIDPATPRTGATAKPFQQDTSVIRDNEIQSGKVGPCGRTAQKGALDIAAEMQAASDAGLPTATASGEVQMTLHQINQDGAGPYKCDMSADGGNTWQPAKVNTNVPGAILGLSLATAKDFPLNVQMPAGMACAAGPNGDTCIVRCRNQTPAGPFGSCVAFGSGAPAAAPAPAAAAPAPAAAAPAPAAAAPAAAAPAPAAAAPAGARAPGAGGAGGAGGATRAGGAAAPGTPASPAAPVAPAAAPAAANAAAPAKAAAPAAPAAKAAAPAAKAAAPAAKAAPAKAATPATGKAAGAGAKNNAGANNNGGVAGTLKNILGIRAVSKHADFLEGDAKDAELEEKLIASFNKRALATPSQFDSEDAKAAELEDKLIAGFKPAGPIGKKRVIRSRVVGSLSGYWI